MDALKAVMVPINREGYRFIAIFALGRLFCSGLPIPLAGSA